jgi:hypothetical protein
MNKNSKQLLSNQKGDIATNDIATISIKDLPKATKSIDTEIVANDEINSVIEILIKTKNIINFNKSIEQQLTSQIKEFMQDNQILKSPDNLKLASWKTSTRKLFSQSAFKEDHPKLYQNYLKDSRSRAFRIS